MNADEANGARSEKLRQAMVEALGAGLPGGSPNVLVAMTRVPRETFASRFWGFAPTFWSLSPSSSTPASQKVQEWSVEDGDGAAALDLLYDVDRAWAIRDPRVASSDPNVTSTISAPRIVAAMLHLLDVSAGMSVLEIGAGSGYNAALLGALVGPEGRVTSMDIDESLVDEAAQRLAGAGCDNVRVVAGDGYGGFAARAPYDRIVATVGCVDLAPGWLAQLAPGGFCLLPLQHGRMHPLTRIEPGPEGVRAAVLGRAGFVAIQGHQAGRSPWPGAGPTRPGSDVEWAPLPGPLADVLRPEQGRETIGGLGLWDLAYFIALEDRRAGSITGLVADRSRAEIDRGGDRIGWSGANGPELRDRLQELAWRWLELGRPTVGGYTNSFSPIVPGRVEHVPGVQGRWVIDRVDFRQTVSLS
jgi:protein-L-isoaspartate(D-aspartate) O-methyltransferase